MQNTREKCRTDLKVHTISEEYFIKASAVLSRLDMNDAVKIP